MKRSREDSGEEGPNKKTIGPNPTNMEEPRAAPSGSGSSAAPSISAFRFGQELGSGAFGKVVLAAIRRGNIYRAIKFIRKHHNSEQLQREKRILLVARACPLLSHLYATMQSESCVCLIMEHLSGGTLLSLVKTCCKLDIACVRFYTAELVCGLQFLHGQGIVHRDIKLSNIMLDRDGHIRIIDFGLALDGVTASNNISGRAGTFRYMAPEILKAQSYSVAVDWWSLGIVVSRMATGHSPFYDGSKRQKVHMSVINDKPKFPLWLPGHLKHLINKLLRKDPENRLCAIVNLRGHPFFGAICWEDLAERRVVPPFKPFPMIFQQDNPGVSFQYFISAPPSSDNPSHVSHVLQQESGSQRSMPFSDSLPQPNVRNHPAEERNRVPPPQARPPPPPPPRPAGTLQRNIRVPPLSAPPVHYWPEQPEFFWRRIGNTPCSVTCGKGFWYPINQCVSRSSLDEVNEEECDSSTKPFPQEEACNTQPCPAFWDVGNWSVCSRTCGSGMQHRQVLCRQMYANRTTMVHPQRCGQLVKPNVTQTCQLRICSHWEIQGNWSTCSVMCGLGQRTRHVRCVSNQGDVVGEGECSNRLRPRTNEICDMGPCVWSWFHNDWGSTCSSECGPGIQRRSVFCLSSSPIDEAQDGCPGNKPSDMRVCNSGPCERTIKWYTGPWSQCSADCDEGSQRRDVICISKMGSDFNVTDASDCAHLEKPPSLQSCSAGPCGSRWFITPWSTCSQSCEGGVQVREVRCLAADRTYSQQCDLDSKPEEKKACNPQPCSSVLDDNCRDRYHNCAVVVQARLCVYAYYKQACCSSCAHSLQRRTSESR